VTSGTINFVKKVYRFMHSKSTRCAVSHSVLKVNDYLLKAMKYEINMQRLRSQQFFHQHAQIGNSGDQRG
jgi:hypothetical protein